MANKIVVVGLSGGVDSSAAAALLIDQGYDVIGVTMRHLPAETTNSCCSLEAVVDARRVAKKLGIKHYLVDVEKPFYEHVIAPFEAGYIQGITPNPCAMCNRHIKFGAMWEWAKNQGADYLATGHYARVVEQEGRFLLMRGVDYHKDQSYLMYTLGQEDLRHLVFPLGGMPKTQTRNIAEARGLLTAHKPDSQELCFVPKNDYQGYLKDHRPDAEKVGEIVDTTGHVVGEHRGVAFYTIGQRRGLGLTTAEPQYVVKLDASENRVVVGSRDAVDSQKVSVKHVHYTDDKVPSDVMVGDVKIRYNMEPETALWTPDGDFARIDFKKPQWAVTPGQVAVLYQDDVVVGGGRIFRAEG